MPQIVVRCWCGCGVVQGALLGTHHGHRDFHHIPFVVCVVMNLYCEEAESVPNLDPVQSGRQCATATVVCIWEGPLRECRTLLLTPAVDPPLALVGRAAVGHSDSAPRVGAGSLQRDEAHADQRRLSLCLSRLVLPICCWMDVNALVEFANLPWWCTVETTFFAFPFCWMGDMLLERSDNMFGVRGHKSLRGKG